MGRYIQLFKNIGLLSISNFGGKILVFLLVPLYTSVLSTAEYGAYDLVITSINLLIPILTINISSGVLRFALDKQFDAKNVFIVGFKITVKGSLGLIALVLINNHFNIIPALKSYYTYFIALYLSNSIYQLCSSYARGIDRLKVLAFAGLMQSALLVFLNIFFLLFLKLGLKGFFLANILSTIISTTYYFIKLEIFEIKYKTTDTNSISLEIKNYSRPLVLNSVSWWINNTADRYIVTWLSGIAANGIYSIAYKIPNIMNVFQSIFLQAWQISAIKEYDSKDKDEFFLNIYRGYNALNVIVCSGMVSLTKGISWVMFSNDFFKAWEYVPFLLIANLFGAMSGLIGGVFSAAKNTSIYSRSTLIGAVINIVLNLYLIRQVGVLGAAIATLISYFVVWWIRLNNARKYVDLKTNISRDLFSYCLLLIQSVILMKVESNSMYLIQLGFFSIIVILYMDEVKVMKNKVLELYKSIAKIRGR